MNLIFELSSFNQINQHECSRCRCVCVGFEVGVSYLVIVVAWFGSAEPGGEWCVVEDSAVP